MMKLLLDYPDNNDELRILDLHEAGNEEIASPSVLIDSKIRTDVITALNNISVSDEIKKYIVSIVRATRKDSRYISFGSSPEGCFNS